MFSFFHSKPSVFFLFYHILFCLSNRVWGQLSQLEREQLKQRQREGIEIAKTQGKYTGRKPIEIDWTRFGQLYGEWKSKSITGRDFMRRMGLSANTFYRRVREYEAENGITEPVSA